MAELLGDKGEQLDLLIRQGATFGPVLMTFLNPDQTPVDLSDMTFRGQIRKTFNAVDVAATFSIEMTDPLNGIVTLTVDAIQTAALVAGKDENAGASKYVWDLEAEEAGGRVLPFLYGDVRVFREVTK